MDESKECCSLRVPNSAGAHRSGILGGRSGLDSDGVALVGAAFGGSSPKLKVNRLQTESEQNVQRGVESLLRGIYQALRNPRSHGIVKDDERDAVAILIFVDYLLRVVDQSRSPFTIDAFVARVLDPDFVPKERYATLLVAGFQQTGDSQWPVRSSRSAMPRTRRR